MTGPSRSPAAASLPVVILAGGFGTRLAEHTDELPKPMVEVGGRPMLWHILKLYGHYGFRDFYIACGYRGEVIKRFFLDYRDQVSDLVVDYRSGRIEHLAGHVEPWRVTLIDTGHGTGTGGRLRRLAEHLAGGTFLMTYGDGVADVDIGALVAFHRGHGAAASFTAVRAKSRFGLAELDGDRVVAFAEKPAEETSWINGGFFALEPEVLDRIAGDDVSFEAETLPALAADGALRAFRHEGFWQPMDTLRDVRTLNRLSAEGAAPWAVWA